MKPWDEGIDPQTYSIIGLAMEVHRELGPGFLEAAYHRALRIEFRRHGIPFESEVAMPLHYKGESLGVPWRADLVCHSDIIVELKAIPTTGPNERAQLKHYLKATTFTRGLLLNFGTTSLTIERIDKPIVHPAIPESQASRN